MPKSSLAVPLVLAVMLVSACGGGASTSSPVAASPAGGSSTAAPEGASVLAADAKSAATGDVPDTQNFLTVQAKRAPISMLYPEGWTVQETASGLSIADKNNLVRVSLAGAKPPTTTSVTAQLAALKRSTPNLKPGAAQSISLKSGPAIKATYTTLSAPNPVTGKQITLTVDRYEFAHAGRVATVDLGTPTGVDNVDAYRRMIESFKWR